MYATRMSTGSGPGQGAPIWARPEPATRRPRFSREQIASAALAIADAEGLRAVSMRRVAADLGAGTMSLYRYISTKDDLIALMDDALMGAVLVPADELPADWRAALATLDTAPFDARGKLDLLAIVDDYVFGHVLRGARAPVTDEGQLGQRFELGLQALMDGAFRAWAYPGSGIE